MEGGNSVIATARYYLF